MLIVPQSAVLELLAGREREVIDLVREAYLCHHAGDSSLPHSTFLRFPGRPRDRIIGLPAYLGGAEPVAGMKWVSSFPDNVAAGRPRASAAILLNRMFDGSPEAVVEGSVVNAKRTAASAALAAGLLTAHDRPAGVTLIGCGPINFEVLRFLTVAVPTITDVTAADRDRARAQRFADDAHETFPTIEARVADSSEKALAEHKLICFGTTAAQPYIGLDNCQPGSVVLHVSLRDLFPATILSSVNVVDDLDHVCREGTSIHLASQQRGGARDFVHASIGELILGRAELPSDGDRPVVFSPFGLGVLDLAVAGHVHKRARERGLGVCVDDFLA